MRAARASLLPLQLAARLTTLSSPLAASVTACSGWLGSLPGRAGVLGPVPLGARGMTASPKKKALRAAQKAAEGKKPPSDLPPGLTLKPFSVALVGRPNVGKSSLFNRLVRRKLAIVNPIPGTTRDWKEAEGSLGPLSFTVMDTGGLETGDSARSLEAKMLQHTARAVQHADVVLFMVDSRAGVTSEDVKFARWVKKLRPRGGVHLIANKTEGWLATAGGEERWGDLVASCYELGFGEPLPLSADHGEGLSEIFNVLLPHAVVEAPASAAATSQAAAPKQQQQQRAQPVEQSAGSEETVVAAENAEQEAGVNVGRRVTGRRRRGAASAAAAEVAPVADTAPVPETPPAADDAPAPPISTFPSASLAHLPPAAARLIAAREERAASGVIHLAVVGRPNAGKSTLVNFLLGEDRLLTGPTAGLTRDPVPVEISHSGRTIRLVDTAGMRRWGAWDLSTPLEGEAVGAAKKVIDRANVVVLVVDASGGAEAGLQDVTPAAAAAARAASAAAAAGGEGRSGGRGRAVRRGAVAAPSSSSSATAPAMPPLPHSSLVPPTGLTRQDLAIAEQVLREGRGLVIVLNKIDAVTDARAALEMVRAQVDGMHHSKGVEVVPVSALRGGGMGGVLPAALRTFARWNRRVSTGMLNRWLALTMRHHPPPAAPAAAGAKGKAGPLKLKFLTQINARPPTFALFANRKDIPEPYQRFLVNRLRDEFDLAGIPLRLLVRASDNPYATRRAPGSSSGSGAGPSKAGETSRTSSSGSGPTAAGSVKRAVASDGGKQGRSSSAGKSGSSAARGKGSAPARPAKRR